MVVDVSSLLRPPGGHSPGALDVDDIRRRVRRRRRNRAVTAVAAMAFAIPLAAQSIPAARTNVDLGPAAQPAGGSDHVASVTAVLAAGDIVFTPADPAAAAIARDVAIRTAQRRVGQNADRTSASAVHGMMTDPSRPSAAARAVWAVRFRTTHIPRRGIPSKGPHDGVVVVILDAADGAAVATVGVTDPSADQQSIFVEESLGAGSSGRAAPAQPMRALGRGLSPRLAALDAAAARGRDDSQVRSVVFIAATDTRVLVEDPTGCWVYSAVLVDGADSWAATGGTTPCDP